MGQHLWGPASAPGASELARRTPQGLPAAARPPGMELTFLKEKSVEIWGPTGSRLTARGERPEEVTGAEKRRRQPEKVTGAKPGTFVEIFLCNSATNPENYLNYSRAVRVWVKRAPLANRT